MRNMKNHVDFAEHCLAVLLLGALLNTACLEKVEAPSFLSILKEGMAAQNPSIRIDTARAIALSKDVNLFKFLERLKKDKDPVVRMAAEMAAWSMNPSPSTMPLEKIWRRSKAWLRKQILATLKHFPNTAMTLDILDLASRSPIAANRLAALNVLKDSRSPRRISLLRKLLDDPNDNFKIGAAKALVQAGDPMGFHFLFRYFATNRSALSLPSKLLKKKSSDKKTPDVEQSEKVSTFMANSLAILSLAPAAGRPLGLKAFQGKRSSSRAGAEVNGADKGGATAGYGFSIKELIGRMLQNPKEAVRLQSLEALLHRQDEMPRGLLRRMLNSTHMDIRYHAAHLIRIYRVKELVPALKPLLMDPFFYVRLAAGTAIHALLEQKVKAGSY